MPHGLKQGCPLILTLFGLYVDGLENQLLDTADIAALTLLGVVVPLLLYADDLILVSESAAGLQTQLNTTASFCEQHQLTVNVSKTKVVVFVAQHSSIPDFVLNGATWREWTAAGTCQVGVCLHATKGLTFGTEVLVAAARKAIFAMRRRCAVKLLGVRGPTMQCKLFGFGVTCSEFMPVKCGL